MYLTPLPRCQLDLPQLPDFQLPLLRVRLKLERSEREEGLLEGVEDGEFEVEELYACVGGVVSGSPRRDERRRRGGGRGDRGKRMGRNEPPTTASSPPPPPL